MAASPRYFVRPPGGGAMTGYVEYEAARTAALAWGEGALVVDTLAQAYVPMLLEIAGGELVYAGYGGWDTGRFSVDRDLIEGIKKGHPAIVEAFLAKGGDANARDAGGGPALHWAAGGGKAGIVALLLARGADPAARDAAGRTALDVARARGHAAVAALIEAAGG